MPGLFFWKVISLGVKAENLRRELKQLEEQIVALENSLKEKPEYGLGTGAPAVTRWEMDHTLLQQLKKRKEKIEHALSQEGNVGICEQCGKPIHADRLAVLPDARLCIACARADGR